MIYDVAIIGAGASGVACALTLKKQKDINIVLLEQNDKILKKVLKTGNGKCNIFNRNIVKEMYNDNSLLKSVDLDKFFTDLGLLLKTDDMNRVYPNSETSSNVVNILLNSLQEKNIPIMTNYKVISVKKSEQYFVINGQEQEAIKAKCVVMSTGSKAQEKTNGYEILQSLNHQITPLREGLVSLITKEKTNHLKGIRVKCRYNGTGKEIDGEILFKENGLSGLLAFDISRLISDKEIVEFDLAPNLTDEEINRQLNITSNLEIAVQGLFPKMLGLDVLKRCNNNRKEILNIIRHYRFNVVGRGSFDQAQITLGGVKVNEVDQNFASKKTKGLFITGEVLDVDGACGGYNLYFAWMSGIISARGIMTFLHN